MKLTSSSYDIKALTHCMRPYPVAKYKRSLCTWLSTALTRTVAYNALLWITLVTVVLTLHHTALQERLQCIRDPGNVVKGLLSLIRRLHAGRRSLRFLDSLHVSVGCRGHRSRRCRLRRGRRCTGGRVCGRHGGGIQSRLLEVRRASFANYRVGETVVV